MIIGYRVVHAPLMDRYDWVQVRFPKSRKKRIRAKWRKRFQNFERRLSNTPVVNVSGDVIYVNTPALNDLKKGIPPVGVPPIL